MLLEQDPALLPRFRSHRIGWTAFVAGSLAWLLGYGTLIFFAVITDMTIRGVEKSIVWLETLKPWTDLIGQSELNKWALIGIDILLFFLLFPLTYVGSKTLVLLSRALRAKSASALLQRDRRRPIVYLRSFISDPRFSEYRSSVSNLEASLLEMSCQIGPAVAIGRPGEPLQTLGLPRLYVADKDWRLAVAELLQRAVAIILVLGDTEGIDWELGQIVQASLPERLLLVLMSGRTDDVSFYEGLAHRANKHLPKPMSVTRPTVADDDGSVGFLSMTRFMEDWSPISISVPVTKGALENPGGAGWYFYPNGWNVKIGLEQFFAAQQEPETCAPQGEQCRPPPEDTSGSR
jgi:hypothetical protein